MTLIETKTMENIGIHPRDPLLEEVPSLDLIHARPHQTNAPRLKSWLPTADHNEEIKHFSKTNHELLKRKEKNPFDVILMFQGFVALPAN
tara:strand:+ start:172 stop:441 length:270 start_codon:yes stop_codon:yes gene_type:complete